MEYNFIVFERNLIRSQWPWLMARQIRISYPSLTSLKRKLLRLVMLAMIALSSFSISYSQCDGGDNFGGTVYQDLPANGTLNNTYGVLDNNEPGIDGVSVRVVDAAGNLYQTLTEPYGSFSFSIPPVNFPVRVEYFWDDMEWFESSVVGANNSSSIVFRNSPSCSVNFGLYMPNEYCETANPQLIVPSMINGNPLGSGTSSNRVMNYRFQYYDEGEPGSSGYPSPHNFYPHSSMGSVWGTAYNRTKNSVYHSAYLKRHTGFGPGGMDAIYKYDVLNGVEQGTPTVMIECESDGVDVGSSQIALATRDLPNDRDQPSYDTTAFDKIGKLGIGGIELSEDDETLFFINLYEKTLVAYDIGSESSPSLIGEFTIPNPCGSDWRPFAIKYWQGTIYVGGVCTEQSTQVHGNMTGRVYRFTSSGFDPNPVLSFSLAYARNDAITAQMATNANNPHIERWNAWNDVFHKHVLVDDPPASFISAAYPQPMITDIEFDHTGNMMIGLRDRAGDQWGWANYRPRIDANPSTLEYFGFNAGDVLKASRTSTSSWSIENNASVGGQNGCGAGSNEGPGGGEFYCGDNDFVNGSEGGDHEEIGQGALAFLSGSNNLVTTAYDNLVIGGQGKNNLNNATGNDDGRYVIYGSRNTRDWSKTNGMGDIEVLCAPPPVEIGNRIWFDTDEDGIQDPGESGIAGVQIDLYVFSFPSFVLISSATTNSNGEYIFSNGPGSSSSSHRYNINELNSEDGYQLRIPNVTGGNQQTPLDGYGLTIDDAGSGSNADFIDSDGSLTQSYASVVLNNAIERVGANNHSFDFGFIEAMCSISTTVPGVECVDNGTPNDPSDDYIQFSTIVTGTNTGSSYIATSPGQMVTPVSPPVQYGELETFRLENGSAGNGNVTIRFEDIDDPSCFITGTILDPGTCSEACAINATVFSVECRDDGSVGDPSDDYIEFTLFVTGTNTGISYSLDPIGNHTITSLSSPITYNTTETFRLENGSAGGGNISINVIDNQFNSCSDQITIVDPGTCSEACDFTADIRTVCDDNGTPADPSDDQFEYYITANNDLSNNSNYSITGDDMRTGLRYGIEEGPFGFFPIDDGNLEITLTDELDNSCNGDFDVIAPSTCSFDCALNTPVVRTVCDDSGTPSDPSDDRYVYYITVTGFNTGSSYEITGDDMQTDLRYGIEEGPFGFFPINGDMTGLDLTIVDEKDNGCSIRVSVSPPETCSGECELNAPVVRTVCNDSGTPSDPSDDRYVYYILVTGTNTVGTYGIIGDDTQNDLRYGIEEGPFGFFPISGGGLTLTIIDDKDDECRVNVRVEPPASCSAECTLNTPIITSICNDNNTPSDPDDDYIEFTVLVDGQNVGSSYTVTTMGHIVTELSAPNNYGVIERFRLPDGSAGSGDVNITIIDDRDNGCTVGGLVLDPGTCSSECILTTPVISSNCNDNGTPEDSDDDYIEFTVLVDGQNVGSSYTVTAVGHIVTELSAPNNYGVVERFRLEDGSAGGGDVTITIIDGLDNMCIMTGLVIDPGTCGSECVINIPELTSNCNDNGTPEKLGDDYIEFTVLVDGQNVGSTYSITAVGHTVTELSAPNNYGIVEQFRLEAGSADGSVVALSIIDDTDGTCTALFNLIENPCSGCPTDNCLGIQIIVREDN